MDNKLVWMHIGAGSFHRSHQAWYLHRLHKQGDGDWNIALGNLRHDMNHILSSLVSQSGKYTLETITPDGKCEYEQITSIKNILPWNEDISTLIIQGSLPETRVIAFTVTESGYYLTPQFDLDLGNESIKADLNGSHFTIYGALSKILEKRSECSSCPVTLLSCDNLRKNGHRFRQAFLSFLLAQGNNELLNWVRSNTSSPNTMVDRITPRSTLDVVKRIQDKANTTDSVPVTAESFIQWVVEDNFAAGRPCLEKVGVEMASCIEPWEEAKIRILNATHAAIAWAGTMLGFEYIHESVNHEQIYRLAFDYISQDVIPSLSPSSIDLTEYRDIVLARFSNPHLLDTNQRVAADGLSKIPGMITPTLCERYRAGKIPSATAVLPALFFLFLMRWSRNSLPYKYEDGALQSHPLRHLLDNNNPLLTFSTDNNLFGELANNNHFYQIMIPTVARLEKWLKAE